jgi:transposase InsO family protein
MSTSKVGSRKPKKKSKSKAKGQQGRRYTAAQKQHVLELVVSGMTGEDAAKAVGTTAESVRRWRREAEAAGTMPSPPMISPNPKSPKAPQEEGADGATGENPAEPVTPKSNEKPRSIYAPKDPGQGLSNAEQAAILELKKRHPSYGPAQLRAQLKRFKGWRVSIKAIARWLKQNGYELVHRESRPQGYEEHRFEAPRRNAIWQMDFGEFWVGREKCHLLVAEDDFSRFVVGHVLVSEKSSKVATELLLSAMARHGKPEAVRTDRGGEFLAKAQEGDFARVLEAEEIDHIIGRSYNAKGGGKVESVVGTVRRELWEVEHFGDVAEATERLASFFEEYNHGRAHMGIDGLTPADRFFGRADQVLAAIDGISRRRQGALAMALTESAPFEEILGIRTGAPLEVLRLVIEDGRMELRFCGARVTLGQIE